MAKRKPSEGDQANRSRQRVAASEGQKRRVAQTTSRVRGKVIEGILDKDLQEQPGVSPQQRGLVKRVVHIPGYTDKQGNKVAGFDEVHWVERGKQYANQTPRGPLEDTFHDTHEGLGLQQRPRNAPSRVPKAKSSEPLGSSLKPPGGVSGLSDRGLNIKSSVAVREYIMIVAAELDRRLTEDVPDPKKRHALAAEMAVDKVGNDFPGANLGKSSGASIAASIDSPRVRQLTDLETGLAHPKAESAIAKSLKAREQGVRDTYRERKKAWDKTPQGATQRNYHRGMGGTPGATTIGTPEYKPPGEVTKGHSKVSRARSLKEGQDVPKGKMTTMKFLNSLSPEEGQWVNQQMEYGGAFYGARGNQVPGAYRRLQKYANARQVDQGEKYPAPINAGKTDTEHPTWKWLMEDNRGRKPDSSTNRNRPYKAKTDEMIRERYTGGVTKKKGTKASDRYKGSYGTMEDSGIGIRVPGIPTTAQLKEENPDASDAQIFQMRESAKQSVDEMLQNSRMAHETRQNTILGRDKSETNAGKEDRVVFFTTSTGYPAVSVGANSLLGQYIIKKRKRMIYDSRMAPRAQLKGEFPYAVRDQHLVEVATGVTVGAQGRYGAFKHVGYRSGTKTSKGYGKTLPIGSQILRDSSGQPLYDRNGNLRYTEGFTRPFDIRPSNEVGLRIYLG